MEELIREKREIERKRELDERREARKSKLLELFKERVKWDRNRIPFRFVDLCDLPAVRNMIDDDECSITMIMESWGPIAESLPKLIEDNTRKIERRYTKAVLNAQSLVSGLRTASELVEKNALSDEEIDAIQPVESDSETDTSVIWRASSFFRGLSGSSETTFSGMVGDISGPLYIKERKWLRCTWPSIPTVDILVYKAATALLSSMNFSEETTMAHMVELGKVFVCQRCHPVFREQFTWERLVRFSVTPVQK